METLNTQSKLNENNISVLEEFNKHFILIISLVVVGAIILNVIRPGGSSLADSIPYLLGQIIALFLIPFISFFITMIFVKNKQKRPKAYYHTFLIILAIVIISNLRWIFTLKDMQ